MDARAYARPVHGREGPLACLPACGSHRVAATRARLPAAGSHRAAAAVARPLHFVVLLAGLVVAVAASPSTPAAPVSANGSQTPGSVLPGPRDALPFQLTLVNNNPL